MRKLVTLSPALALLALSGCGGSWGGPPTINPYAGDWSGVWTETVRSETGSLTWTVLGNGALSGTYTIGADSWDCTGTVSNGGGVNVTLDLAGAPRSIVATGNMTRIGPEILLNLSYRDLGNNRYFVTSTLSPGD